MVRKMLILIKCNSKFKFSLKDIEVDSIPASHATKSVYSADSINDDVQNVDTVQSSDTSESNSIASPQKRPHDTSDESDLSNDAENKEKVSKIS